MKAKVFAAMLFLSVIFCGGCVSDDVHNGALLEIAQLKQEKAQMLQWFVIAVLVNNAVWFYFYGKKK